MEKEFPRLVWVQVCYGKRDPQTSIGQRSLWEKRSTVQYRSKIPIGKEIPRPVWVLDRYGKEIPTRVWVHDRYGKRDSQTSMGPRLLWEKRSTVQYGSKIAIVKEVPRPVWALYRYGKEIPTLVWVQDHYGKRDPQTSMGPRSLWEKRSPDPRPLWDKDRYEKRDPQSSMGPRSL